MTDKLYLEYAGFSAYQILEKLEITELPIKLGGNDGIAERLGIKVLKEHDFNVLEKEGKAFVDENNDACIWLNPFQSYNKKRQRFTFAHEIAHIIRDIAPVLKQNKQDIPKFIDGGVNLSFERNGRAEQIEYSANEFAGQLLMPKAFIIKEANNIISKYKKDNNNEDIPKVTFIERMAKKFNVSEPAMSVRLKHLDIIK